MTHNQPNASMEGLKKQWDSDMKTPGAWNSMLVTPIELGGTHYDMLDPDKVWAWIESHASALLKEAEERKINQVRQEIEDLSLILTDTRLQAVEDQILALPSLSLTEPSK